MGERRGEIDILSRGGRKPISESKRGGVHTTSRMIQGHTRFRIWGLGGLGYLGSFYDHLSLVMMSLQQPYNQS